MRTCKGLTILSIMVMSLASAQAMVVPGRWEKVGAQKPGSKMIVSLMTGDIMECSFVRLTTDSLFVATPQGVERNFSKANVARIVSADKRADSLANGAAIGAVSAGIPVGIIALVAARDCYDCQKEAALAFAMWTGIGAGIGLLVDAGFRDQITLYEARK